MIVKISKDSLEDVIELLRDALIDVCAYIELEEYENAQEVIEHALRLESWGE